MAGIVEKMFRVERSGKKRGRCEECGNTGLVIEARQLKHFIPFFVRLLQVPFDAIADDVSLE